MKCKYCNEKLNNGFNVTGYEMTSPKQAEGLKFDSLYCMSEYAKEHNFSDYDYISCDL